MSSIEEAFKARMVDLDTLAADRIYREVIEQEPEYPAVSAFVRTGGTPLQRTLDGRVPVLQHATLRVEVIAASSAQAEAVAAALRAGLDGWYGTSAEVEVLRSAMTFQGDASFIDGDIPKNRAAGLRAHLPLIVVFVPPPGR